MLELARDLSAELQPLRLGAPDAFPRRRSQPPNDPCCSAADEASWRRKRCSGFSADAEDRPHSSHTNPRRDQWALDAARPGWAESPTLADDVLTYFRLFTGLGCAVAGRLCATAARLRSSKTCSTSDFMRSGSGIRLGSAIIVK